MLSIFIISIKDVLYCSFANATLLNISINNLSKNSLFCKVSIYSSVNSWSFMSICNSFLTKLFLNKKLIINLSIL